MGELCTDPDCIISEARIRKGRYRTKYDRERKRARVLSTPLPGGSIINDLKFYVKGSTLRQKYNLIMFGLEDKIPPVYSFLVAHGLPKPYQK